MKTKLLFFVCFLVLSGSWTKYEAAGFDHGSRKHRELKCSACHTVSVKQPNVTRFPYHNACASCHDFAQQASTNFKGFCGACHSGVPQSAARPAVFAFPRRNLPSEFGVSFSHDAHLKAPLKTENRTMKCMDCHSLVRQVGGVRPVPEVILGDAHANCFRCHGMTPEPPAKTSMTQCAGCHQLGGPKSPDLFGIVPKFAHADHIYDIRPRKKVEYQKKVDLCFECHSTVVASTTLKEIKLPESDYCAQCHNGKFGLPEPLPQNVLSVLASLTRPIRIRQLSAK